MLKTLDSADVSGKRILLRVAYDIKPKKVEGKWTVVSDGRIRATLPTINYLLEKGCSIILLSWLDRPEPGDTDEKYKMDPIAEKLGKIIKKNVKKIDTTIGTEAVSAAEALKPGELLMLENSRLVKGEKEADPEVARQMAKLGDFVVYDAFAQAHRVHASTTGILENHKTSAAVGFLMEGELRVLGDIRKGKLERPFALVFGGAKITDKVQVIDSMMQNAGAVLIGGALANTFFKAEGCAVGASLVEGSFVNQAKGDTFDPIAEAQKLIKIGRSMKAAEEFQPYAQEGTLLQIPTDAVVARKREDGSFDESTQRIVEVDLGSPICEEDEAILDIGPKTISAYKQIIHASKAVFWNGPMGMFEQDAFAQGTKNIAEAIVASRAFSIVGGGDTESVVDRYNLGGKFSHVSTGGGASLEFLSGEEFPVLKYLLT